MQSFTHILSLLFLLFAAQATCSPLWWDVAPNLSSVTAPADTLNPPNRIRGRSPGDESVNPNAITGTTCIDNSAPLVFHDTDVALLSICGGISGKIEFCGGNPATTVGSFGTSKFTLTADKGATINVSKGRWEGCVRAARAACPGTFSSTCIGGVSSGAGFKFVLSEN